MSQEIEEKGVPVFLTGDYLQAIIDTHRIDRKEVAFFLEIGEDYLSKICRNVRPVRLEHIVRASMLAGALQERKKGR